MRYDYRTGRRVRRPLSVEDWLGITMMASLPLGVGLAALIHHCI